MKQTNWWMIATLILLAIIISIIFYQVINTNKKDKQNIEITIPKIAGIYIPTNLTDSYAVAVFNLKDKNQLDLFNNLTIKFMELAKQ